MPTESKVAIHLPPARPLPRDILWWALVAGALALAVFVVFRGALDLFFAQEDFRGLAVEKGLLPRHSTLWRYVSAQGFMDLLYPLFGDHPKPYHFVSIAVHAVNAALLCALLSRRLAPAAAFLGASFFATHPTFFTAIYWQSARSDLLATMFGLITVALSLRQGRARWLAIPTFALALLSKESVILLPLAIWLLQRWAWRNAAELRPRDLLVPTLCGLSALFGIYLLSGKTAGISVGTGPEAAYALDFGKPLLENFLTYVGWTTEVTMRPSPLRFVDVRNSDIYGWAVGSIVVWGLGCLLPGLRSRGWIVAAAIFLLLLVPALPLRNHTYHYFLYAPLAAAAWCPAAAFDFVFGTRPRRQAAIPNKRGRVEVTEPVRTDGSEIAGWVIASLCLVLLTWNGARLVHRMETRPMRVYPALRGDAIVSRAIVAENIIKGLKAAGLPEGSELVFLLRERLALLARISLGSGEATPPPEDIYPETNARTALFEGYGVRALLPGVSSVTFARDSIPMSERARYVIYAPEGTVMVLSRAELDSLLRSRWITEW